MNNDLIMLVVVVVIIFVASLIATKDVDKLALGLDDGD